MQRCSAHCPPPRAGFISTRVLPKLVQRDEPDLQQSSQKPFPVALGAVAVERGLLTEVEHCSGHQVGDEERVRQGLFGTSSSRSSMP